MPLTLELVKELLQELNFVESSITDQTALTVLALADSKPRTGLLPGHERLTDGARIHDILTYVREDHGRRVAENTRESYRKTSLRPLIDAGWVVRHQLATNDPNTYYRLNEELARLLRMKRGPERQRIVARLRLRSGKAPASRRLASGDEVVVQISEGETFTLSSGAHNELERAVVETLAPAVLKAPSVVYLGDTSPRAGFQNRPLMRRLNLPIDVTSALPDVILFDSQSRTLLVVEVVTSSGPITPARLAQLRELSEGPQKLGVQSRFASAFASRRSFRPFLEKIAWETSVWLADEPYHLIHFAALEEPPLEGTVP